MFLRITGGRNTLVQWGYILLISLLYSAVIHIVKNADNGEFVLLLLQNIYAKRSKNCEASAERYVTK